MKKLAAKFVPVLLLLAACSSGLEEPYDLEAQATAETVTVPLATVLHDAEEVGGRMQLYGKALDFVAGTTVGLRFSDVRIPPEAEVTGAFIAFRATAGTAAVTLELRGEAADNAAAFTATSRNISTRGKTTALSTWQPASWTAGLSTRTPDLTSVVQEVVSRGGWRSGNALAFTVTHQGGLKRAVFSRDVSAASAPVLHVSFEVPSAVPEPTPEPEPELPPLPSDSLEVWNSRLVATITNPKYGTIYDPQYGYESNSWMDPVAQAGSGDLFVLGRNFNQYATGLILAYREGGDPRLMRQLDVLMDRIKETLGDPNGDGYLNWRYLNYGADSSSSPFIGDDYHEMDEMLTHSVVAATAYALKSAGYGDSAAFWTDYLQNDFEAKWRARKNKASGFPFLTKNLMHPYVNWIRYHLYMGKLTGDSSYTREAARMAGVVRGNMRLNITPSGSGYEWGHFVQLGGSESVGCQPMVYVRYTTQALVDLATQASGLFDDTFMQRVANTMAHKAWKRIDGTELAGDVCGGGQHGSLYYSASHPYTLLAPWDASGRLEEISVRAYYATERGREASPRTYTLPAVMVFTLGW